MRIGWACEEGARQRNEFWSGNLVVGYGADAWDICPVRRSARVSRGQTEADLGARARVMDCISGKHRQM